MLKILATIVFTFTLFTGALASPSFINKKVPNADIVGTYKFEKLVFDVYNATLYAPNGSYDSSEPFALELEYLRTLYGNKIAERSIKEMRGQGYDNEGQLSDWQNKLNDIFPDVGKGDTITGVKSSDNNTIFYFNGEVIGTVEDAEFTKAFFDIWLSEQTSEPTMRRALIGE